ncbi:ribosome maturation factor RimP [Frankia sp. R43]|uniref:ribosome maturation factor RimP n=1 Tax=Frankia sp. R43 TaxID=269536 RepID=UPI0006CA30D9|nr:ribosome maturation factor RimP [Frankia sp. R43]KPM57201.1 ribosome maturation factor RimP [Frankia sp. R43]
MARAGNSGRAEVRRPTASSRGTGRAQTAGGSPAAGESRAAADAIRAQLRGRLEPRLAAAGFDLEDVTVARAGSRSVVRVVVDRDEGIDLDAVADASRIVSAALDEDEQGSAAEPGDAAGARPPSGSGAGPLGGPYVLEVTSPGVDRPLVEPRHWRRAVGRLVLVRRADGSEVEGRVLSAGDDGADLAIPTGVARRGRPARTRLERVVYSTVTRATVQVEFGAPAGSEPGGSGENEGEAATGSHAADLEPEIEDVDDVDDLDDVEDLDDFEDVEDLDDSDAADEAVEHLGADGADPTDGTADTDETAEDHDAVGAEAGRGGRNSKEMNR